VRAQETELKKEREKEKKRKAPKVSSNKGEVHILRGEKHFNSKILFDVISFSPPPSYHFKFSSIFLDHPLAWQHT
jgi:hypothetical protein